MKPKIINDFVVLRIDFLSDGRAIGLSKNAELVARRAIEIMIWIDAHRLPTNFDQLKRSIGADMTPAEFRAALAEVRNPDTGIFQISPNNDYMFCKRLTEYFDRVQYISKKRSIAGQKGGSAKSSAKRKNEKPGGADIIARGQPEAKRNYQKEKKNLFEQIFLDNRED